MPYKDDENYKRAKNVLEKIIPQSMKRDGQFNKKYFLEEPNVQSVKAIDSSSIKVNYGAKVKPNHVSNVREILIQYIRTQFPQSGIEISHIE